MAHTNGKIDHALGLEELIFQNGYTTQGNLQTQCNPYQISNGIFYTTRTKKNQNLYGNPEDPKQPKLSWERKAELEESGFLTSDYTTKLQSSKQYGTSAKIDIKINGTEQKAQK